MATDIANAIDEALTQLGILVSHTVTCVPVSGNPFNYSVTVTYIPQFPVLGSLSPRASALAKEGRTRHNGNTQHCHLRQQLHGRHQ